MTWKPLSLPSPSDTPLNPTLPARINGESYSVGAGVIARSTAVDKSCRGVAIANQRLYINSPVEHNISCQALEPVKNYSCHQVNFSSVEDIRFDKFLDPETQQKRILPPFGEGLEESF